MTYLIVEGGHKLRGDIDNQSAKNAALYILYASLMIKGITTLKAMPEIEEVSRTLELFQSIGVKVKNLGHGKLGLDTSGKLDLVNIDRSVCEKTRASLFLFGALTKRANDFKVFKTGGCKLGKRTIKPHVHALEKLGVQIESHDDYYLVHYNSLKGDKIVMYESGDTATANAIMAAVLSKGKTTIKMASANYMVQDLCFFLQKAGAKIKGVGTTTLEIEGVASLKPVKNYPIMPDPIVAMTLLAAGIVTKSEITVKNCPLEFLELELTKLEVMGQKFSLLRPRKSKNGKFDIVDIKLTPSKLMALADKIEGRPFPGLNIDNLPLFIPILTQAEGRTLVHDWAYENRAVYALDLQKMGAQITLLDPHRVWVEGPSKLKGKELMAPPALRPAVNVLISMLAAEGTSILRNTYEIDRGYENLYEVLNKAGAKIEVIKE
ncbi:MAG TPA: UDP-N-acetylglucosamine 1-carboxyvinyltransferase [Patescibacteria group bacterium]|nr:UDP-N-acetylglucosamine 1-carboxyvinyltransferase [Patescibacteria group bacterium]